MDPLSVTASIIAIIGVSGSIGKTLRKIALQKNAPDFILLLSNELADLHLVVLAIQKIYQKQQLNGQLHSRHNVPVDNSITTALTQAQHTVTILQTLHDCMSAASAQGGVANLKTKIWLLEPHKARRVHDDLRNTRLKLIAVLGLLNSYVTGQSSTNFMHSVEASTIKIFVFIS